MQITVENPKPGNNKVRVKLDNVKQVQSVIDDSGKSYGFHFDENKQELLIVDCERCDEFIIKHE